MNFEKFNKEIEKDWYNFFDNVEIDDEEGFGIIECPTEKKADLKISEDKERNHLIIALAKNRNLWKWINKTYDVRKHEYYMCYKNTFFYKTPLKEVFSLHTKEYINKLAGIGYWCKNNNSEEPLIKIIQKEHNKLYSRFKVGIKEFDLDKFIAKRLGDIEKKSKDESEILLEKNNKLEELITVTLYLARVYDVEVTGFLWKKLYSEYMSGLFSGIKGYMSARAIVLNCDKAKLRNLTRDILELDYKKIKDCKNLNEFYGLLIIEQSSLARKTSDIMIANNRRLPSLENLRKEVFNIMMSKGDALCNADDILDELITRSSMEYVDNVPVRQFGSIISYFFTLPKISGLEKEVLLDVPINIDIIESAIVYTLEENLLDCLDGKKKIDNSMRLQTLTSITIMALFEYYKNLELTALDQEEEMVVEIDRLNSELSSKDEEIAMLKEKIEQMNKSKKNEIDGILHELDLSKKNVKRLKKELEVAKEDQVEFIALKEYVYRNSLSESELALTFDNSISIEDKIKYLNDRKIAVFGGHPNWVNKLKKLLPDAKYIDTNAFSSRKFNRLDKYDLLVICNLFISHGLSWKIGEAIKNVKSKKVIIIDDINTDLIINNLYDTMKEYEATC